MKVGVIDCSNQTNSQICRDYEIMAYPTVRYFPPHPSPTDMGTDFLRSFTVQAMKNFLVELLKQTQSDGNLTALCDIQPFKEDNVVLDSNNVLTYIIIDKPDTNDKFAQELVIDYCPVKKVKIIYALNTNTALVNLLKVDTYPSLYRVHNSNEFNLLASGDNKTQFIDIINENLKTVHMTPFNIIDMTTKLYNLLFQKTQASDDFPNTVYLSDLEATLKYSLDHEIVMRSVISNESLDALKSYLELLVDYFPSTLRGKKAIKLVLESIQNNKTVSGKKLGNFISKYEMVLNPFVTKQHWIGCEGSNPMYRRYPCGLWTLFHTLTVQASLKDLGTFNGVQVLETIAGYVKHFFGCTDCSEHFLKMATTINSNVSSLDDAVLWLWSAHNQVNQRLAGDVTEDPMYPKVLFPLKVHCEKCRQDDEWNNEEVLKYLKKMYSTISLKHTPNDNSQAEPQSMSASQNIIDDNNYNIFEKEEWKFDINTCMISYVLSCSVLMILFYLLVVKKKCKKNKYIYFILGKV